jgi:DNA-binding LacI/PurR family transcriptional regulator
MTFWQRPSAVSLLAGHLRDELLRGRWSGRMPGVIRLADELGVARKTAEGALRELEREGLLVPQGHGRGRMIDLTGADRRSGGLRIGFFAGEAEDLRRNYILDLRHQLAAGGHSIHFPSQDLFNLGMDTERIARMASGMEVDAWVVMAGSRGVLEWFAAREAPVMAIFGRRRGLPIASVGPDKVAAMSAAARELIRLGHRRIVLLARRMRRLPEPGASERAVLEELSAHGIEPGTYHLPDWEESVEGFHECLEALFQLTPPTALVVEEVPFFLTVQQFLAGRGIRVPEDVSLVCTDHSPDFDWFRPTVAHIHWNSGPLVRRILRWASKVANGGVDRHHTLTSAEFVEGGTIGPVVGASGLG